MVYMVYMVTPLKSLGKCVHPFFFVHGVHGVHGVHHFNGGYPG